MTATAATIRPASLSAEPMAGVQSEQRLRHLIQYWRACSAECPYGGLCREAVVCSALTLKLLSYAPTSGCVSCSTPSGNGDDDLRHIGRPWNNSTRPLV